MGSGRGKDWEFGISKQMQTSKIGLINNKVLLYSPGNYIQYPVINHNGKEYEKEYIYVSVSLSAAHQRLTHYKSTMLQ